MLPLQFKDGTDRNTLGLDGTETYDVVGDIAPGCDLALVVTRSNGEKLDIAVTCRLDTADEVTVYSSGGVLQRFAQDFLAK
ncbi:2-methylcitrate dehydratase FeS dependent [Vibrio variabilis]|uniref:2-methylcitrate dehydratase FeS dependent n=1 Tax=Vibrio variabilis TaxID=990271 RepID=A0ABQ0JJA1_9VIBR|nr:2-methylcitrate dehydratase FeS dependent [Vibrio variabilis]